MYLNKKIPILILMGLLHMPWIFAQTNMNIIKHSGEISSLELDKIRKITFLEGNMITELLNQEESIMIDQIKGITFSPDPLGIRELQNKNRPSIFYHNSYSEIEIRNVSHIGKYLRLAIYDPMGRLQAIHDLSNCIPGQSIFLNIETLEAGYYIGTIMGRSQTISFSFIKD